MLCRFISKFARRCCTTTANMFDDPILPMVREDHDHRVGRELPDECFIVISSGLCMAAYSELGREPADR